MASGFIFLHWFFGQDFFYRTFWGIILWLLINPTTQEHNSPSPSDITKSIHLLWSLSNRELSNETTLNYWHYAMIKFPGNYFDLCL